MQMSEEIQKSNSKIKPRFFDGGQNGIIMKNIKKVSIFAAAAGISVILAGCGTNETNTSSGGGEAEVTLATDYVSDRYPGITISDAKYDAANGIITATVKNDSDNRIDQAVIDGTIDIAKQDSAGNEIDDPVDIRRYFSSENIIYATKRLAVDIPAHGSKEVRLLVLDEGSQYRRNMTSPKLFLSECVIRNVGEDAEAGKEYYADASEYSIDGFDFNLSGENVLDITVTNKSAYKWKSGIIAYSYVNDSGVKKYSYADITEVNPGEKVKCEHILSENGKEFAVDHISFEPENN